MTGTVLSGAVAVGDRVAVSPSGLVGARALDPCAEPAGRARRGRRAMRPQSCRRRHHQGSDARAAMSLDPASACADRSHRCDACELLGTERKPVGQWMPVRLHHAAAEVGARIVLLGDAPIPPGGEATIQLVLERPIAAAAGDRFVLRDTTAQRTIGGGRFLDLRAPGAQAPHAGAAGAARGACSSPIQERRWQRLLRSRRRSISIYQPLRATGRSPTARQRRRSSVCDAIKCTPRARRLALSAAMWQRLKRDLVATLEKFHADHPDLQGIGLEGVAPAAGACGCRRRHSWRFFSGLARRRRHRARRRLGAAARATRCG